MKVIIAGSRSATSYFRVKEAMKRIVTTYGRPEAILSGTAKGGDRLGERWARDNGVPIERYPADWDRLGTRAGIVRNRQRALAARPRGALVAIWDGHSPGTKNMIDTAIDCDLVVIVKHYDEDKECL